MLHPGAYMGDSATLTSALSLTYEHEGFQGEMEDRMRFTWYLELSGVSLPHFPEIAETQRCCHEPS